MRKQGKVLVTFILSLSIVATLSGCSYYKDTYKGVDAWAKVPDKVPAKKQTVDENTKKIVSGNYTYKYNLHFYVKDGNLVTTGYSVSGGNPSPLKRNSYVYVKASKKRVINGPNYVNKSDVPDKALA